MPAKSAHAKKKTTKKKTATPNNTKNAFATWLLAKGKKKPSNKACLLKERNGFAAANYDNA